MAQPRRRRRLRLCPLCRRQGLARDRSHPARLPRARADALSPFGSPTSTPVNDSVHPSTRSRRPPTHAGGQLPPPRSEGSPRPCPKASTPNQSPLLMISRQTSPRRQMPSPRCSRNCLATTEPNFPYLRRRCRRGRKTAETRGRESAEVFGSGRCGNAWPSTRARSEACVACRLPTG